ncbi:MAG TPA: iron-containing redox enzyme family protein [Chloroflexota bacterium]|nr:iron-containing redox enzyme family protein [Chloroflexota bacterium]
MENLIDLRTRVRGMYAELDSPPQTPYFPPPPERFLEPEQFVDLLSEAVLANHTKINHPFCVKLVRGNWTPEQLQAWVKQDFHAKVQTIRNDAMIVATSPSLEEMQKQASVVASEAGADNSGYPSHPELWLRFGEGLGLSREEIMRSRPSPLMQVVLDAERYRSMSQRIGGLPSNMRLGERINAVVYPIWADALEQHYSVRREALAFFTAHGEADEDHGEIGRQIVIARATDFETQREIWQHHEASQAKQWINYDVFYQAALKVAELAPA